MRATVRLHALRAHHPFSTTVRDVDAARQLHTPPTYTELSQVATAHAGVAVQPNDGDSALEAHPKPPAAEKADNDVQQVA